MGLRGAHTCPVRIPHAGALAPGAQAPRKASVSNDARRLAAIGIIELVSRPGDRRDYYRIAPDSFAQSMRRKLAHVRAFHAVLQGVQGLRDDVAPIVRARLEEFEAGTREVTAVLEHSLARWQSRPAAMATATDSSDSTLSAADGHT